MVSQKKKLLSLTVILAGVIVVVYLASSKVSFFSRANQSNSLPLFEYGQRLNFNIGTEIDECENSDYSTFSSVCQNVLKSEYLGMISAFNADWKIIESNEGDINFKNIDRLINFAKDSGIKLHYFHLLGIGADGQYLPSWVFPSGINGSCDSRTSSELDAIIKKHIQEVIRHAADSGVIVRWNVINEAFDANGQLRDNCFSKLLPNYIDNAFNYAREVLPNGFFVLNENFSPENNTPGNINTTKVDGFFAYVRDAKNRGVRIDAIGLENHLYARVGSHFDENYLPKFQHILDSARAANVKVIISEMDVYQANKTQDDVARVYKQTLEACLHDSNCISFQTWGISDGQTWLHKYGITDAKPLLFDENYQKKPAYYAIVEALSNQLPISYPTLLPIHTPLLASVRPVSTPSPSPIVTDLPLPVSAMASTIPGVSKFILGSLMISNPLPKNIAFSLIFTVVIGIVLSIYYIRRK